MGCGERGFKGFEKKGFIVCALELGGKGRKIYMAWRRPWKRKRTRNRGGNGYIEVMKRDGTNRKGWQKEKKIHVLGFYYNKRKKGE